MALAAPGRAAARICPRSATPVRWPKALAYTGTVVGYCRVLQFERDSPVALGFSIGRLRLLRGT